MDIRAIMNLIEGSSIYPSKKHGSDHDYDDKHLAALEKAGVGKGPSIEDQKKERDDAKERVADKREKRAVSEEERVQVREWLDRILDNR
jgi:hypothetical protein